MADPAVLRTLRTLCLQSIAAAGLQTVAELFHHFPAPGGVTGVLLLAESHLAVHTWPQLGAVALNLYVCNLHSDNSERALTLLSALEAAFGHSHSERHCLVRGKSPVEVCR